MVTFRISRKTEVWNLESEVVIEEDILRFQISVRNSYFGHVFHSCNKLLGIGTTGFSTESSLLWKKIKEFTTFCKFQDYKCSLFFWSVTYFDSGLKATINNINEVRETKLWEKINLNLPSLFFAGSRKIDLECKEGIVLTTKVDTRWKDDYLACPPSPRSRWILY